MATKLQGGLPHPACLVTDYIHQLKKLTDASNLMTLIVATHQLVYKDNASQHTGVYVYVWILVGVPL
jgi:hypothetical protein